MCGIWLSISDNDYYHEYIKIQNRGPDMSVYQKIKNIAIGFHRLAILETNFNGSQPYIHNNKIFILKLVIIFIRLTKLKSGYLLI